MAWLKDQAPAAGRVRALLDSAERRERRLYMNVINLGEVYYISAKLRNLEYAERVVETLRSRLIVLSASDELVFQAAGLKARHALSYADAFAAVTAISRSIPLVTGDPELKVLGDRERGLELEWIAA